jgi:hypothetical protein
VTFVSSEEIPDGKGGQSTGVDNSSITRSWRVYSDSPYDTPIELQPFMLVDWGTPLASNTAFICTGVDWAFNHKGPSQTVWTATYTFSTQKIDQEELDRQQFPNPLDRRCRCSVNAVRYGELVIVDRDGNVKRTSAGEIYEPREKDAIRFTVNLSKNYRAIPSWVWDLQDKINNAAVTIRGRTCATGTLKYSLNSVGEIAVDNGVRHFPISWTLDYRREGWKDKRVDAGFYYLNASDELIRIKDDEGNATVVEEWLDGTGGRLRDIITNPQPGDETINEFDDYLEGDFSDMPLDEVASADAEV